VWGLGASSHWIQVLLYVRRRGGPAAVRGDAALRATAIGRPGRTSTGSAGPPARSSGAAPPPSSLSPVHPSDAFQLEPGGLLARARTAEAIGGAVFPSAPVGCAVSSWCRCAAGCLLWPRLGFGRDRGFPPTHWACRGLLVSTLCLWPGALSFCWDRLNPPSLRLVFKKIRSPAVHESRRCCSAIGPSMASSAGSLKTP